MSGNTQLTDDRVRPITDAEQVGYREAFEVATYLIGRWRQKAQAGMVLGSGLSEVVRQLRQAEIVPYSSIPRFPLPSVEGHAGRLHFGYWGKVPVAILEGRTHLYEGYSVERIVFPVRVLALTGIEVLITTCAAGGIAPRAMPGAFMILSDHLNLQGINPLAERHAEEWGTRFVDLRKAYDPALRREVLLAGKVLRLKHFQGVYAAVPGPNYETPAEVRALRRMGADAVGMSTVPEVLAARQMGARVLAVAIITNRAAGLSHEVLSHDKVLERGNQAATNLTRLLDAVLPRMVQRRMGGRVRNR